MSAPTAKKAENVEKALAAWGDLPDWVLALAEACDAETQTAAGRRIDYSGSAVSQILSNTYRGDMPRVEIAVRGALMAETVSCPLLGDIARNVCLNWQRRPFSTASANAVRMYQACRSSCPHSRINQNSGD